MINLLINVAVIVAIVLIAIAVLFIILKVLYKKAPPNVAMVVTGPSGSKTVVGRGCFVIPGIQRADYMPLENIQSDFTSKDEIPTKDAINILVDAVANFCVSDEPEVMKLAASKFLGYSTDAIASVVRPVLEGNIREIISQLTLKELIQGDKKIIAEQVIQNVTPNLNDMGLKLTTFNIQNFKDKNGVIANLGMENTVQISKDASISKASAEKEIAIARADAEKASNTAAVAANLEIAKKQNELEIKQAELKSAADVEKAKADMAYEIQKETQQRELEIKKAEARIAAQEKAIELKEREVAVKERELEATVKKQADADRYAAEQRAEAELYTRQKQAEADLAEKQRQADALKAKSEADKVAELNRAASIKAVGEAEALSIQKKAEAEAEGLLKKAEAMAKYGEAAKQDMQLQALKVLFEQYPAIAEAIGKGYSSVDKIIMYGDQSSQLAGNMITNITQVTEGLNEGLGIDVKSLLAGALGAKLLDKKDSVVEVEV